MPYSISCLLVIFTALNARADEVRVMTTGELGVAQIHHDLTHARTSIDISTFIWEPGSKIAKMIVADALERRRHGVRVRILIDAWTQTPEVRRNLTAYFKSLGFEARHFNVRADYDPVNNRRMHAKMIVVDRAHAYVGGRNIADDYFDMGTNNWLDRDVAVTGRTGRAAAAQFEMLWSDPMTSTEDQGMTAGYDAWAAKSFAPEADDERLRQVIARDTAELFRANPARRCRDVTMTTDEPGFADQPGQLYNPLGPLTEPMYARKHTSRAVVDFIAAARRPLTIENYTYVPEALVDDALTYQRNRGLPITVYTNENMDTGPIHFLKEQSVLKDNVGSQKIVQISNEGSLAFPWDLSPRAPGVRWNIHTKSMVTGDDSLVGSFNIDPRSYLANLESTVVIKNCPALADDLRRSMTRLDAVFERDRSCAKCHEKVEISAGDQLKATVGRRLYFKRP